MKEEPAHRAVLLEPRGHKARACGTCTTVPSPSSPSLGAGPAGLPACSGCSFLLPWRRVLREQQNLCAAHLHEVQRSFNIQITEDQPLGGRSLILLIKPRLDTRSDPDWLDWEQGDNKLVRLGQRGQKIG